MTDCAASRWLLRRADPVQTLHRPNLASQILIDPAVVGGGSKRPPGHNWSSQDGRTSLAPAFTKIASNHSSSGSAPVVHLTVTLPYAARLWRARIAAVYLIITLPFPGIGESKLPGFCRFE